MDSEEFSYLDTSSESSKDDDGSTYTAGSENPDSSVRPEPLQSRMRRPKNPKTAHPTSQIPPYSYDPSTPHKAKPYREPRGFI